MKTILDWLTIAKRETQRAAISEDFSDAILE